MISTEKLVIYKKYGGQIDFFERFGSSEEKSIIKNDDWHLIDGFIQDIEMIDKGLISKEYKLNVEKKLLENINDSKSFNQIINTIRELSSIK